MEENPCETVLPEKCALQNDSSIKSLLKKEINRKEWDRVQVSPFLQAANTAFNKVNQFIDVVLTFFVISFSLPSFVLC